MRTKVLSVLVVTLAIAGLTSVSLQAQELWSENYEESKALAEREGKDLLLEFTGSDWCPYCVKMRKEVFEQPDFKRDVPKDFVLVVNNGAVVLEAFGEFGNFSVAGPFLNVQTASLDMHIRQDLLASAFAVEKPSHMDGVNTLSIQFFTPEGTAAFKVFLTFGGSAPAPERVAQFEEIKAAFKL
jgi:thiol-disulfide isomerase/thioredoxin